MRKYRRFLLPLAGLAAALALSVPFLFWYQTWFGRKLSEAEIGRCLEPIARPRDMQHALSQLGAGMERGEGEARQWYPEIAALSRHEEAQIRLMTAWVMGQDNQSGLFHEALLTALKDPEVMVRRNAALALVRFGDASGRAELDRVLQSGTDETQVWEALRGLYLVGQPGDLAAVSEYQQKSRSVSGAVRAQAELTAQAIRMRTAQ